MVKGRQCVPKMMSRPLLSSFEGDLFKVSETQFLCLKVWQMLPLSCAFLVDETRSCLYVLVHSKSSTNGGCYYVVIMKTSFSWKECFKMLLLNRNIHPHWYTCWGLRIFLKKVQFSERNCKLASRSQSPNGTVGLVGKPKYTRTELIRLGLEDQWRWKYNLFILTWYKASPCCLWQNILFGHNVFWSYRTL